MGTIKQKPSSRARVRFGAADALFTKVQQRVLALLFGFPARSFYANELITLARSGSGAVQRELAQLEAAGLVTVRRIGNQKHYQANALAPIFQELRDLVLKTPGLVDILAPRLMIHEDRNDKVQQSVAEGVATRMTGSPVEKRAIGVVPAMIEQLRGDIAQLCKRYRVRELALFGSVLRTDFNPTSSDVDAAVKFGPP
ncbi:MAG: nucleotidyltransferase domain-containing protein, partial [Gammaproteobacteria bacterium]